MRHGNTRIPAMIAGGLLATAVAQAAAADGSASPSAAEGCRLGGSGLVVHLDPRTGRPTSVPLPEQANALAALQAAQANRSTVGLVQERGPTGGVRVDLRDRFRSPVVAVVDGAGRVRLDHLNCAGPAVTNGG